MKNSKNMKVTEPCGFLKSLEPQISRELCDSEAYFYRENFVKTRDSLTNVLYNMYNHEVFNDELDVEISWSTRLRNTAGMCRNNTL